MNATYLKSLDISKGIIRYQYNELIVKELSYSKTFAQLELDSLRRLPSNKSLILFEIAGRYVANGEYKGYTPAWSLLYFRNLMGANSKTYNSYKNLNAKIIKPSLQIINNLTEVKVTQMSGKYRRIRVIKFHAIRKAIISNIYEREESLINQMELIGLKNKSHELLNSYGEKDVKRALEITYEKDVQGGIKESKAGYFRGTLKKINPNVESLEKQKVESDRKMRKEKEKLRAEKAQRIPKEIKLSDTIEFLKTLELTVFEKIKNDFVRDVSGESSYLKFNYHAFRDSSNWCDRIYTDGLHDQAWLDHVEDYQK